MGKEFLNDLNIHGEGQIQFKTSAGANAGKIDQSGNNLVLSNAVGDVLLGDGSSDVYIGDGTNNVDIIFEQSGAIKGDGSSLTLTLGGSGTTLDLQNPVINGTSTVNNKMVFPTSNSYIVFDYEPSGDTGEYSTEVPLIKVDMGGSETTILSRVSEYRGVALGADDTVWLRAGDTGSVIKTNVGLTAEVVLMSAEQGFHSYAFPNNDTTWSNRNEFRFYGGSATASQNGLYIGDGGNTQFIDLNRNLVNIGTINSGAITSGAITSSGKITVDQGSYNPASGALMSSVGLVVQNNDGNMELLSYDDNSTVSNNIGFGRYRQDTGALIHKFGITTWALTGNQNTNAGDKIAINYGTSNNPWSNTEIFSLSTTGNATFTGSVTATSFSGDGSNITGITASNADTVDNLHAASFLRSDASDTGTGTITLASSSTADNPLILGSSSQTDYTLQQWQTSAHGTNKAYILAYGAGHSSQAGNFAIKNIITDGEIFFELASGVEPLRMTSTGATFAGTITASNFSGSSSGTNTGDQDLSGLLLNTTDTLDGVLTINTDTTPGLIVKNNSNSGKDASIVIRGARNSPSAGVNPAKLVLQSYDSDAGSGTNVTGGEFYMEATSLTGGSLTDFEVGVRYRKDGSVIDGFKIHDGTFTVNGNIDASNFSGSSSGTNTGDQDLSGYYNSEADVTQHEAALSIGYDQLTGTVPTWNQDTTGSAGSVAWGNITGKPSTFAPSSHNHDSRYLRKDVETQGTQLNLGGEISAGSSAKLQVYGFQRTGPIMIAQGNTSTTSWNTTNEKWLMNNSGNLYIGNGTDYSDRAFINTLKVPPANALIAIFGAIVIVLSVALITSNFTSAY
jgi:hypothetical protein